MKKWLKKLLKNINEKILPPIRYAIIEPDCPFYGFFAHFINICGDLNEAIRCNQKTFIDMKKNKSIYISSEEVGKVNAWERYFEQPFTEMNCELAELSQASLVVRWLNGVYFVKLNHTWVGVKVMHYPDKYVRPNDSMDFLTNEVEINYWREFVKKYIKFNADMVNYVNKLKEKINFIEEDRIVGVLVRGTDFINKRPYNHPVPPSAKEALDKVKKVMNEYQCKKVFLATEDISIYKYFENELGGGILLSIPQIRLGDTRDEFLSDIYVKANYDLNNLGQNYIATILLLSMCNCLLSSRTSGGIAALIFSEGYDYTYFWNKGRYGINEYMSENDR